MSTEIALRERNDLKPVSGNSLQEIMTLGNVFKASGYFKDIKDEAQAVTKILYGREFGLTPIVSMSAIYIVEGKPSLSANMLGALVKRSGKYDYKVKVSTATKCVIEFFKGEESLGDSEFTIEDAKTARVAGKDNWQKYPKAMLFARALSAGVKLHCPDVTMGPVYVPEELGATVNESGDVTELPASKAPANVKRTTEEIQIEPISATPIQATEPLADNLEVKGESSEAPKAETREPGSDDGDEETIGLPLQRALHRAFREAIRNPEAKAHADNYFQDWLKHQGYIGPDGKGTTKTIPVTLFDEVKRNAVKFALEMPAK